MRNIKFLLQKEFRQIFWNTAILRMILVMPILQLILIPLAADYEVKEINLVVVDNDHSSYSRRLVEKVQASDYFQLQDYGESYQKALNYVEDGQADLILTIPANFERDLYREQLAELHIAADAVDGVKAGWERLMHSRW